MNNSRAKWKTLNSYSRALWKNWTVIPIVSYGFGFGAGGNVAQKSDNSAGTGAGGGIKPLGAIIFDKDGARVLSVKGTLTNMTEVVAETATAIVEKWRC